MQIINCFTESVSVMLITGGLFVSAAATGSAFFEAVSFFVSGSVFFSSVLLLQEAKRVANTQVSKSGLFINRNLADENSYFNLEI